MRQGNEYALDGRDGLHTHSVCPLRETAGTTEIGESSSDFRLKKALSSTAQSEVRMMPSPKIGFREPVG